MPAQPVHIKYNSELAPLEQLLAGVKSPGDFYSSGIVEVPMPQLQVDGVGTISFPVPAGQVEAMIAQARRAPYGRGGETFVDTGVRRVWQLLPEQTTIRGKSWEKSFGSLLEQALEGLGCDAAAVTAEL
jgi:hypothetical protein